MTQFISKPDSIYAGNPGFLAEGILPAYATGSIGAGELCVLHESGNITRADPTLSWDVLNSDGGIVLSEPTPVTNITFAGTCTTAFSAGPGVRLPCGVFVVPCHPRGSIGVGFVLRASNGSELGPIFTVYNDTCTTFPEVLVVREGFALIWHASSNLRCQLFDRYGVAQSAVVLVSSGCICSGKVPWHSSVTFENGHFHIGWATSTGFVGQRFSGVDCSLMGSLITFDSFGNGAHHYATPCKNGDFLICAWDAATTKHKFYRYTNAGVHVWGPLWPCAGTSLFASPDAGLVHPAKNRFFEMDSDNTGHPELNNFVFMGPHSDGWPYAHIIDYTGSLVKRCDIGQAYHEQYHCDPIIKTPSGFAWGHALHDQPNTYGSFFDCFGNVLQSNILLDDTGPKPPAGSVSIVHCYMEWSGTAVVTHRYYACGATVQTQFVLSDAVGVYTRRVYAQYGSQSEKIPPQAQVPPGAIDPQWIYLGNYQWQVSYLLVSGATVIQASESSDCSAPFPCCGYGDGIIFTSYWSVGTLQLVFACHKIAKSSVIGCAQAAAADGQAVTILGSGYFQLPSTQTFPVGSSFDRRNSLPWGTRGSVGGRTATLAGWV